MNEQAERPSLVNERQRQLWLSLNTQEVGDTIAQLDGVTDPRDSVKNLGSIHHGESVGELIKFSDPGFDQQSHAATDRRLLCLAAGAGIPEVGFMIEMGIDSRNVEVTFVDKHFPSRSRQTELLAAVGVDPGLTEQISLHEVGVFAFLFDTSKHIWELDQASVEAGSREIPERRVQSTQQSKNFYDFVTLFGAEYVQTTQSLPLLVSLLSLVLAPGGIVSLAPVGFSNQALWRSHGFIPLHPAKLVGGIEIYQFNPH